jgi:hypothetical protein
VGIVCIAFLYITIVSISTNNGIEIVSHSHTHTVYTTLGSYLQWNSIVMCSEFIHKT